MYEDTKGNFWIGTYTGLNQMDRKKGTFTSFTEMDGLCSNVVQSILEDSHGNLWLSTGKGIAKFNPTTKVFHNFYKDDGLYANEFGKEACLKTTNGELYFGNVNGFLIFHPDNTQENDYVLRST